LQNDLNSVVLVLVLFINSFRKIVFYRYPDDGVLSKRDYNIVKQTPRDEKTQKLDTILTKIFFMREKYAVALLYLKLLLFFPLFRIV